MNIFNTDLKYNSNENKSLIGFTLGKHEADIVVCAPNYVGSNNSPEGMCFLVQPDSPRSTPSTAFNYHMERALQSNRPYDSHNLFGFATAFNEV